MSNLFLIAIIIFILTYAFIISEKIHRTIVALMGAVLMIVLGVINQKQAIEGIDFNTLGLLIGMMIVVAIAKNSGVFEFVAIWTAKAGKGKPIKIFILISLIIAFFSAILDNVTTVVLMIPVIFVIANNLEIDPKPLLIGAILMSNIGGTATLIGDPPNIMVGSAADLSFNNFLVNMGPISVLTSLVTVILLIFWYRKKLITAPENQIKIMAFKPQEAISNKSLLIKSLIVIGIILTGFFTHSITHLEGATIALGGAALLLLITMNEPERPLREVEWTTIFFFLGLFILVIGIEQVGVIRMGAEKLLEITGGNLKITTMAVLWGSAVLSAVVDNIPFVATMIPLIKDLNVISGIPLEPLWWALLLGANFGGNATIIGASANVIVSGIASREGHKISFIEYIKVATPFTLLALILSNVYIYICYLC